MIFDELLEQSRRILLFLAQLVSRARGEEERFGNERMVREIFQEQLKMFLRPGIVLRAIEVATKPELGLARGGMFWKTLENLFEVFDGEVGLAPPLQNLSPQHHGPRAQLMGFELFEKRLSE
jgi:hypothetical protein